MMKYSRSALFLLLALFLACDSAVPTTQPLVRLRLTGLPAEANKVTVTIKLGEKEQVVDFTTNGTDSLETLTVSFPPGTTGEVTVSILAYDAGNCLIGSGSGSIVLTNDDVRELMLTMTKPMLACGTPAAKIIIQIANTGSAVGVVTSVNPPGGINCGDDCEEVYAAGATVTLHAEATSGSFFGWSGACSDTNDCTLTVSDPGEYVVKAAFGTRPCQGWCPEPVPAGLTADLYGVWGTGPSNVLAVGTGGTIVRWNGMAWTQQTSNATETLRAITLPRGGTSLISVGNKGTVVTSTNGTQWSKLTAVPNTTADLYGVAGAAANEVFIVGHSAFWNGSATGFSVRGVNGFFGPPSSISTANLNAISASPSNEQHVLVGDSGYNLRRAVVLGGDYVADMTTVPGNPNLNGIWYGASNVYAVGAGSALVRRSPANGSDWTTMTSPVAGTILRGVWGSADNNIYAVGDNGTLLYWDATTWIKVALPNLPANFKKTLRGVWGTGANNIYVVGDAGTIIHYLP